MKKTKTPFNIKTPLFNFENQKIYKNLLTNIEVNIPNGYQVVKMKKNKNNVVITIKPV